MKQYFGEKWDAPDTDGDDVVQVPTPVGQKCILCDREIVEGDVGWLMPFLAGMGEQATLEPEHRGCLMASTIGHMFGFCSCTGYDKYEAGVKLVEQANAGTLKVVT